MIGSARMEKSIDANTPPREQPAETGIRDKDLRKARDGAAAEMKEDRQADRQILP